MLAYKHSTPSCPFCRYDLSGAEAALRATSRDAPPRDPSVEPHGGASCGPSTGPSRADQPSALPPPSGRGRCSECGQEFDWTDAYRARNNYFDDLPRADLWSGFGRSFLVALFPWTSWKVESAARFRLRRTWLVTAVACAAWHALAAAWVVLMQSGWLSPWGMMGRESFWRIVLGSWSIDWGFITSRTPAGAVTMQTMGGNGMLEPLGAAAACWSIGIVLLGLVIAVRPRPNCGMLWARVTIRSIPVIGAVTLLMSTGYVVAMMAASWSAPGGGLPQNGSSLAMVAYSLLLLTPPVVMFFLTWTRHVRDTGLFSRTWPIVTAMIVTPVLVAIGWAALTA